MRVITDLHIHSKYSRATSRQLDAPHLDLWSRIKGIDLLSTGDITHPGWRRDLEADLVEDGDGVYVVKPEKRLKDARVANKSERTVRFVFGSEISCIYSENDRVYRNHIVFIASSLEAAKKISTALEGKGCNLKSDGRPIIGLSVRDFCALVLEQDPQALIIPAHIWTPWFSTFGSKSGSDTLLEPFGEYVDALAAVETGLSSDPAMNWRVSQLDNLAIISNSDAHSPEKLGREGNVFDLPQADFTHLRKALFANDPKSFLYTIEFFPEEGKYHLDGHRACGVVMTPKETKKVKGMCPTCGKQLTVGVEYRVEEIADREKAEAKGRVPFKSIVPLPEIIADAYGVKPGSKKVTADYDQLVSAFRSEFDILLDVGIADIARVAGAMIAEGVKRVREGKVQRTPGYDGEYGVIRVFSDEERAGKKQGKLFEV